MSLPRLPLTVLGGYLGAGKTTLLNRLLSEDHGQRILVMVNDFGAINIDASLIAAASSDTLTLSNGSQSNQTVSLNDLMNSSWTSQLPLSTTQANEVKQLQKLLSTLPDEH